MALKVTSGQLKGLKLVSPEGGDTRPTRERIRQAAVNAVQPWIPGAVACDLFAGSGAMGFELGSRGASSVTFVEKSKSANRCLSQNMAEAQKRIKSNPQLQLTLNHFLGDVQDFLNQCAVQSFDLIWADPPYEDVLSFVKDSAERIEALLRTDGVFVLESKAEDLKIFPDLVKQGIFKSVRHKEYGTTLITIWNKR